MPSTPVVATRPDGIRLSPLPVHDENTSSSDETHIGNATGALECNKPSRSTSPQLFSRSDSSDSESISTGSDATAETAVAEEDQNLYICETSHRQVGNDALNELKTPTTVVFAFHAMSDDHGADHAFTQCASMKFQQSTSSFELNYGPTRSQMRYSEEPSDLLERAEAVRLEFRSICISLSNSGFLRIFAEV